MDDEQIYYLSEVFYKTKKEKRLEKRYCVFDKHVYKLKTKTKNSVCYPYLEIILSLLIK